MTKAELIIWDWNGTLLNDVEACVKTINILLERRNMMCINANRYRKIFTFPVQDYYKSLGFDFEKEPFEELSLEYISLYNEISKESALHNRSIEVLKKLRNQNIKQIILSASEQKSLEQQVKEREIDSYFDSLIGLDNIYAKSKLQNGIDYVNQSKLNPKNIYFVGDTFHDYEVSKEIGCKCILINKGHQDLELHKNLTIVDDLSQLLSNIIMQ
ncbi:MAG: HAD hydrolase-like protein [Bacteroidales bacterium]|nr:HAD hydrolase-like protein [Bacteroidales bacterium]